MNDEASREMDAQAARNGYMVNPNHSNARYMKGSNAQVKAAAFKSKNGYSGNGMNYKMKDKVDGLPVPSHMRGKDCP